MDDIKDVGLDEMTQRVSKHKKEDHGLRPGELPIWRDDGARKEDSEVDSEEENPKCGPILDVK